MPKTLLITGASTGFGRDMAETLAKSGHRVFASMRDPSGRNRERANALWSQGIDVVTLDVTDDQSVEKAVQTVLSKAGRIDVLINSAGIATVGITEAFSAAQFHAVLNTNVVGLLRTARAVLPSMRAAGEGLIVNVGSVMGRLVFPFFGLYGACKSAAEALTESLRYELSPFGVEVVLVQPSTYPSSIDVNARTPDDRERLASYGDICRMPGALLQRFSTSFTGGNAPDPHDVSIAVAKLVDTDTGQRPMRTIVGSTYVTDRVNESLEAIRRQVIEDPGMANLGRQTGGGGARDAHATDAKRD